MPRSCGRWPSFKIPAVKRPDAPSPPRRLGCTLRSSEPSVDRTPPGSRSAQRLFSYKAWRPRASLACRISGEDHEPSSSGSRPGTTRLVATVRSRC
jgi:hypothetical protein